MERQRFDIVFRGETAPGVAREDVARSLVQVFRTTPETVERLLDGGTHTLKRGLDADTAQKYRAVLERAGAIAVLVPVAPEQVAEPAVPAELTLAPAGADVLAAHERRRSTATAPDTAHIELAPAGADLDPGTRAAPPPPPDTSRISLAEPGERLAPPAPPPPAAPDTSHLTVAPPNTPLGAAARPAPPVPLPDISGLELLPPT